MIFFVVHLNKERKVIIWEDARNNVSGNNNQTKNLNKIHCRLAGLFFFLLGLVGCFVLKHENSWQDCECTHQAVQSLFSAKNDVY